MTNTQGFDTIQVTTKEEEHDETIVTRHATNVQLEIDPLSKLYAKVAHTHMMTFQDYCSRMQSLNRKHELVMYNRAWCKSYIDGMQHGQKLNEYRLAQLHSRWVHQLSIQHSFFMTSQEPNQAGKSIPSCN